MTVNEKLYGNYFDLDDDVFGELKEKNDLCLNDEEKLACPLFLKSTDEYEKADVKVMVFGQETNGWNRTYGETEGVDDTIDKYDEFFNSKKCYELNTPFWNVLKEFHRSLQEKNKDKKVEYLWNNLVKIGYSGRNKGFPFKWYDAFIKPYFNELIPQEINILKPNFIVFFTGPNSVNGNYDNVLNDVFGNPSRKLIEKFSERELCEIEIPSVKKAFRTYHPSYLFRNNKERPWKEYIEKIVNEISGNIASKA
jgi:hypothetical protein